jgi:hypothetical protein
MKKKIELVPYKEKKLVPVEKKKINTKKLILPSIILVAILILIVFISSLLNPSNKAKKYLESNGYICNKQTCTKDENNNIYTFNYERLTYYVDTDFYYVNIGEESPSLTLKDDDYVCAYTKEDYKTFTLVDSTFIYNQICDKYVEKVNSHIKEYEKIITESKINVNR